MGWWWWGGGGGGICVSLKNIYSFYFVLYMYRIFVLKVRFHEALIGYM